MVTASPPSSYFERLYIFRLVLLSLLAVVHGQTTAQQPSYSLPIGVKLWDGQVFEYIVVGAGAAGSAAAARLALAGANVLLIEAGGDPDLVSRAPAASMALLGSALDYHYDTVPNNVSCLSSQNKACVASRGKCLGGSTSINYMMYVRGNRDDFDSLNITGWSWNDVEPYFLRYEGLQDLDLLPASSIPYHNTTGTMKIEFFEDSNNPWHSRIVDGYEALNFPNNPDVNAATQIGVSHIIGYTYDNLRMSTARGYLGRTDVKRKLKVAKFTTCTGVIIDDNNVARGVTVAHGLFKAKLRLYAKKEVILSAGALVTPQLLMLSGIGPAEHLNELGIPLRVDLSVGDDMTDHTLPLVFIKVDEELNLLKEVLDGSEKVFSSLADIILTRGGSLGSIGLTDVTGFVNTLCYDFDKHQLINNSTECELPTTQFIHAYIDRGLLVVGGAFMQHSTGLEDSVIKQLTEISKNSAFIIISSLVLRPKSSGRVRLASADPLQPPTIFPNYLSDDRDVEEILRGINIIKDLMETPAFKSRGASMVQLELEGCPRSAEEDWSSYWGCYARHMTYSTFHSVGTTALGRVVDGRLRVRGVRRLRAADAGVLPRPPRGNTAAAAIALGERAADFVLEDDA
ncbi:ecdysone oxidase-like [Achroia grisella]|uniref:ecdysone oxidase-like n=1 Tax=Achroia grisella TaxID=688607 RepID=UPI0027D31AF5|nr:ecdysone oxidase-like [Achroia grisella]